MVDPHECAVGTVLRFAQLHRLDQDHTTRINVRSRGTPPYNSEFASPARRTPARGCVHRKFDPILEVTPM